MTPSTHIHMHKHILHTCKNFQGRASSLYVRSRCSQANKEPYNHGIQKSTEWGCMLPLVMYAHANKLTRERERIIFIAHCLNNELL